MFSLVIIYSLPGFVLLVLYYIGEYMIQNRSLSDIPSASPWAALTRLWLVREARFGRRYLTVDKAHKTHGDFVRIQPNHVSIANVNAINAIYGHGNGFLKRQDLYISSSMFHPT